MHFFYSITFFGRKTGNKLYTTRGKEQCKNRWGKWKNVSPWLNFHHLLNKYFFLGFFLFWLHRLNNNWCKNRFEHFLFHVAIRTVIRTRHEIQWLNDDKKQTFSQYVDDTNGIKAVNFPPSKIDKGHSVSYYSDEWTFFCVLIIVFSKQLNGIRLYSVNHTQAEIPGAMLNAKYLYSLIPHCIVSSFLGFF